MNRRKFELLLTLSLLAPFLACHCAAILKELKPKDGFRRYKLVAIKRRQTLSNGPMIFGCWKHRV